MSLYWKVSTTLWLSSKILQQPTEALVSFLFLNSTTCLGFVLKNSAQNRSAWSLSTLRSCFPGIPQHCCFWIWSRTWRTFLLPTCTHSRSLMARCAWFARGTHQLKLAFLPTEEPHPWLSFRTCWHKLLHPHSRPVAPSHPCLGEWWLREVGCCSGSTETEEKRKPLVLMPQSLRWEKGAGWFLILADSRSGIYSL